jgi:glycosyltransferase involved in cell wall biosynthesis
VIKVVYFGHQTDIAGGEISLLQLIDSLDKQAVAPEIIVPGPGRFKDEVDKRQTIKKHVLNLPHSFVKGTAESYESSGLKGKLWNVAQLFQSARKLRKILKQTKPDILHTNTLKAAVIATIATVNLKVKLVYHDRTQTYNRANRIIHKRADRVIAISEFVRSKYEGLDKSKIIRVYNGVKDQEPKGMRLLREEYGIAPEDVLIGIVGRIVPWKGHRCFIDAAIKLLQSSAKPFRFIVVGSADIQEAPGYEEELRARTAAAGFEDRFIFTGYRSDAPALMRQLDVLVVASIEAEAFGRVIIEGQMAGLVVVASRIGGIPELIQDGQTGLLFEPGSAEALYKKLEYVVDHPEAVERIKKDGCASAHEHFNIRIHSNRIERLYAELLYGS